MKKYYYILKDGRCVATTFDRENAIDLIRAYQANETHYLLRANFSIIEGNAEEFVSYEKERS